MATKRFEPTVQLDNGLIIPASAGIGLGLTSDASGNGTWGNPVSLREQYDMQTGVLYETIPRSDATSTVTPGTQTLWLVQINLHKGVSIGHITFTNNASSAGTPTNWWFTLHNNLRVMLAQTADQLTAPWANSTPKSLAIAQIASGASATFVSTYTGPHYLGFMMKATTVVTLIGKGIFNGTPTNQAPILIGSSSTGQTTPPAFPFTAGALTFQQTRLHATVSA